MVGLTAAVSYLLPLLVIKVGPWNNDIGPAWLAKLDSLLTCRISLTWMAYRLLDVKIAGQVFNWPTVDNSCLLYTSCFVLHRRSNCGSSATVTVKNKNLHRVKWRFLVY